MPSRCRRGGARSACVYRYWKLRWYPSYGIHHHVAMQRSEETAMVSRLYCVAVAGVLPWSSPARHKVKVKVKVNLKTKVCVRLKFVRRFGLLATVQESFLLKMHLGFEGSKVLGRPPRPLIQRTSLNLPNTFSKVLKGSRIVRTFKGLFQGSRVLLLYLPTLL